ncbi:MAG: DegT/DnrJ/EryC1/StrS family aminotransferase [Lachnospiraceae bacterium]|nr:DegT/DnrJ/EryC1/StrS family aminotransferase [Lachnospiraceae bacterium]
MEFRDLKRQYNVLKADIDKAVSDTLERGDFISGASVRELEQQLADYIGVKYCITCGNGTDALTIALRAWNIGSGDAVFVPDFTFFASGEAPASLGAAPVFVDVDRKTFNMMPDMLEQAIQTVLAEGVYTPKVIIAVDLFGLPADYDKLRKIADKYGLKILEDGAQGFGGMIGGKKACSFGDIGTTSFFPAKPLGCYGDGGAIFTNDTDIERVIRSICVHGKGENKYDNIRLGTNSRLDTLQAAILQVKLRAFQEYELEKVNEAADLYNKYLNGYVKIPEIEQEYYSSYAQYTIVTESSLIRRQIQDALKRQQIPSMTYYAKGMHEQPAFHIHSRSDFLYPNTDYLKERVISLPMHPYLTAEEIEQVSTIIRQNL